MFLNIYYCEDCKEEWECEDDCACNDKCPVCNKEIVPTTSADFNQEDLG